MKRLLVTCLLTVVGSLGLAACGDDDDGFSVVPPGGQSRFSVHIENVSDESGLPTPFAPGVWAITTSADALFSPMAVDRGEGLEALAEDGDPGMLADALSGDESVSSSGTFDTPDGAAGPAVILPGEVYSFGVEAAPGDGNLTLATMLVQSNDLFVAASGAGIPLFDGGGAVLAGRDVTSMLSLWDAGTEQNQAPAAGPDQAPRQAGPNTGPREGVVSSFRSSTRALADAGRIVEVSVERTGDSFDITLANVSGDRGAMLTPLAPVFFATHDASWAFFEDGGEASRGLEELAEDGSPVGLVDEHDGVAGVGTVGAQATTEERPGDPAGPAMPGERFRFNVNADAEYRYLSFAAMIVESNDAFLAVPPNGVALVDAQGNPRSAAMVEADIRRLIAVWDAGTETNEVSGVGVNQPLRQAGPDTGPADADGTVRRFRDATNDLAEAASLLNVTVVNGAAVGTFDVTVTNRSEETVYPTPFTPVVWALHDDSISLFEMGEPSSTELERLAEDGDPGPLADLLATAAGVGDSGVEAIPVGACEPGPLLPGGTYAFTVVPDATHRYLSFAAMVVQSNDAYASVLPGGVALLDDAGLPRDDDMIATDLDAILRIFDAGTEANQVGAAGPDQALRQAAPDTGPAEGSGLVRPYDDPVWSYPDIRDLVRVTIEVLS
jgi:hypothetical protein